MKARKLFLPMNTPNHLIARIYRNVRNDTVTIKLFASSAKQFIPDTHEIRIAFFIEWFYHSPSFGNCSAPNTSSSTGTISFTPDCNTHKTSLLAIII